MDTLNDLVGTCDASSSSQNALVGMAQRMNQMDQMIQEGHGIQELGGPSVVPNQMVPVAHAPPMDGLQAPFENLSIEDAQKELETLDGLWGDGDVESTDYSEWFNSLAATYGSGPMGAPALRYNFSENNPFIEKGVRDGLSEMGIGLFHEGRLDEAIWALEAFIQTHPEAPREVMSDMWRWLGTANAENDNDSNAILCLRESTSAHPENIEALMDMGVCCTNELAQNEALTCLREWLKLHGNPEVRGIWEKGEASRMQAGSVFVSNHKQVVEMYEEASRVEQHDSDIFSVLGVLYNLSRQYDMAEAAFSRALELDPTNYSLWNKLGATQANSPSCDGSKRALKAYRKALELKPTYTRAWVNMGISYSNIGLYDLAAKYYLKSLSLNPGANHVWSYLRIALDCLKRPDLAAQVKHHDLNLFRRDFEF
uniref:Peroxin-5 n=1 Tax=Paramoeba aestuarina TaxID=180227 RepID=A0A7S4NQM2_9EUKA|mmetsp:Transcript_24356/g.37933  ORF Transcript_24356/g.37933 Transcript_24356/m.37933 type:complete len:426 (+) Transcript_24356:78-1355(+)|eukprot:CAMPEP_0201523730 /NCGR_PEP_ID=MMETSP0161_2-20130828/20888_1 /ASSEMBLY_ACC=CAM_ASM_000251 /TAXON_ID=180227 /ORGANISM="Neoparamoeba aestuarina, Strain SoJaBio B1-5/56/2" /LENGTH=425 /DNA_ID=CAMNT_0047922935 /DNA_START=50 /DNA_END=1327 /DNA_ORIENTATION=-